MEKIHQILDNLRNDVPQALARFNDGEIQGIVQPGCTVARGDQKVSLELSDALREAISYQQENYWVGIPCDQCNTAKWYKHAIKLVDPSYKYLTKAVVTTNRNWKLFVKEFKEIVATKENKPYWIGGQDQDTSKLPFETHFEFKVPRKNAWQTYEQLMKAITDPEWPTCTWVMACGPMSRVIARKGFEARPDCTFLDVGSAFDPYTRDVWHSCHKGTLAPCKGCN